MVVSGVEIVTEVSDVVTVESGVVVELVVESVVGVPTEVSGVLVLAEEPWVLVFEFELGALEVCAGPVGWSQVPGVVTD